MTDEPFIDIHTHVYPEARIAIQAMGGAARAGFTGTPEELVPFMAENGIEAVAMCNFTPIADMIAAARARLPEWLSAGERQDAEAEIRQRMAFRVRERNGWSCRVSAAHPALSTFIGVDPVLAPDEMEAEVEVRYRAGARGIKLHPPVQRVALDDPRLRPALAAAQRLGMIVLTHMGPFGNISGAYATTAQAAAVAETFPRLQLVLAHCAGPDFDAAVALAEQYPQLVFDCCGVASGTPGGRNLSDEQLVALFRRLGTNRVAFGSDWCFRDPRPDVQRIKGLGLTRAEERAILHDTAARLLGLS
jgi:predicted TIM-barrel fold metal-dependent hydrolase